MLSWDSQELLGGSMWRRGESVLCECLAYGLWDHNKAVLNVCEDAKLRLQAEELVLWQEGAGAW